MQTAIRNLLALSMAVSPTAAYSQSNLVFSQLPQEIRSHVKEVQSACLELDPDRKFNDMSGIRILDLSGDGSRDIFVNNELICGNAMAGAGCSNRGCDLRIYKQASPDRWTKIFEEHLHDKHIFVDW